LGKLKYRFGRSVLLLGRNVVLFMSHMANDMIYSSLPPLLPLLAAQRGLSAAALGVIPAAYMAVASFLQMGVGVLYDKRPTVNYVPLGLLIGGAAIASIGYLDNYFLLVACAVIGGVGSAFFHPTATSLSSSSANRSVSVSFFVAGGGIGLTLGALLSSQMAGQMGLKATTIYLPITMAAAFTALLLLRNNVENKRKAATPVSKVWSARLLLLLTAAVFRGVLTMSYITYLPLYLSTQGYTVAGAGVILTLLLLAGAAGMVPAGFLADKFGRLKVVAVLLALSCVLSILIVNMPAEYVFLPVAFLGFFAQAVIPLLVAEAHEVLPNNLGLASALMYGASIGLSNLAVPVVGAAIDHWGYRPVFLALSSLPFIGSMLIVKIQTIRYSFGTVLSGKNE
jgi:MFS transporter, FSR family, fosmidomycin resistance protein